MGNLLSDTYFNGTQPEYLPPPFLKPTYDPEFGFRGPRKERVSLISEQEMKALQIPKEHWNYCLHHVRDYYACYKKYAPFHGLCKPETHAYHHCMYEDYVLRMKEYEREKRLRMREMRLAGKTVA